MRARCQQNPFCGPRRPLLPFLTVPDTPPPETENQIDQTWEIGFHWLQIWYAGGKMTSGQNSVVPKFEGRTKWQKLVFFKPINRQSKVAYHVRKLASLVNSKERYAIDKTKKVEKATWKATFSRLWKSAIWLKSQTHEYRTSTKSPYQISAS